MVVLSLLYVFYKNVYPVPPSPFNRLPYIFAAALLLGLGWYLFVWLTARERTRQVGTYEEEPVSASTPSSSSTT